MERLVQLIEEYKSIQLAKSHYINLTKRLQEERIRFEELSLAVEKEYKDVLKFEKLSLRGIFNKLLVDTEQQYEIEKQEYLLAVLQLNETEKTIELLEFEQKILEEKLEGEQHVRTDLNNQIEQKQQLVYIKYPMLKEALLSINKNYNESIGFRKEIREALILSLKLEDILSTMIKCLNSAKEYENWGEYYREIQEGKKKKKSYLDEAQQLSILAKQLFLNLEGELEDIYNHISFKKINRFEDFLHFTDIYHERLISDWIIKIEISSSLNYLIGTNDSIKRVIETLKISLQKTEKNILKLSAKRKELLIQKIL